MVNNTFELLWRDISPLTVGFDRTFDTLSLLANSKQTSNYPPYNIRKVNDEQYTIELAVAGFEESELDIEAAGESLTVTGSKDKDASEGIVHQGLAARNFVKKFVSHQTRQ
jgi:molecular chaperone IbpA